MFSGLSGVGKMFSGQDLLAIGRGTDLPQGGAVFSRDNVSNALSRGDVTTFLRGFSKASVHIRLDSPSHFASKLRCL